MKPTDQIEMLDGMVVAWSELERVIDEMFDEKGHQAKCLICKRTTIVVTHESSGGSTQACKRCTRGLYKNRTVA